MHAGYIKYPYSAPPYKSVKVEQGPLEDEFGFQKAYYFPCLVKLELADKIFNQGEIPRQSLHDKKVYLCISVFFIV